MLSLTDTLEQENETEESGEKDAFEPKKSLRGAINAYCRECIYDEFAKGGGTWRQQTEACTLTKCPLYDVRPISKPRKLKDLPLKD